MNSRLRNGLIIAFLGISLLLVAGLVFSLYLGGAFQPVNNPAVVSTPSEKILVAARDLPVGTQIQEGDYKELDVPVAVLPRDYITDPALVVNRVLKIPMFTGEYFLEHQIASPTDLTHDIPFVISENEVLVAFQPSDLMTSLGVVEQGDVVDIHVTMPVVVSSDTQPPTDASGGTQTQNESRTFTFNAMQRIVVTSLVMEQPKTGAAQSDAAAAVRAGKIQALLIALTPQDALLLKYFKDNGAVFDLVIRSPMAEGLYETKPILQEYIRDRYGLEIPRQP